MPCYYHKWNVKTTILGKFWHFWHVWYWHHTSGMNGKILFHEESSGGWREYETQPLVEVSALCSIIISATYPKGSLLEQVENENQEETGKWPLKQRQKCCQRLYKITTTMFKKHFWDATTAHHLSLSLAVVTNHLLLLYGHPYRVMGGPLCFTPMIYFFALEAEERRPWNICRDVGMWCNFITQIRWAYLYPLHFEGAKTCKLLGDFSSISALSSLITYE